MGIRRGNLLAGAIACVGGLLGWALAQGPAPPARGPGEAPPPLVRVAELTPGPHRFRVLTHGTVTPRTESELMMEVAGRVVWVSPALAAGGFFDEGEKLLEVDRRDYANALDRARARVTRVRSQLSLASIELERLRALADREVASASVVDRAHNVENVERATLAEARADLERAELDLERSSVVAPFAGRVREKRVDVGQFVARGASVARVYAVDFAEVRLPVRDADLAFLDLPGAHGDAEATPGPEVWLRAHFAGRAQRWRARIVRSEGAIDSTTRMLHLVARIEDPYGRRGGAPALAVGLFVEAEILGRALEDVLLVPRAALRGERELLVVDGDDRLRLRTVDVLRFEGDRAVVRAALASDERLCLSPLEHAVEGAPVRPVADVPGAGDVSLAVAGRGP